MFDIGFFELLLFGILGLLILGPERLPEAVRTIALWWGRLRRSFAGIKTEFERELGADEIRRQLHNETILENLKKAEQELKATQEQLQHAAKDTRESVARQVKQEQSRDGEQAEQAQPPSYRELLDSVTGEDEGNEREAVSQNDPAERNRPRPGAPSDEPDPDLDHSDAAERDHSDAGAPAEPLPDDYSHAHPPADADRKPSS